MLFQVCRIKTGVTVDTNPTLLNEPDSPNQWWRFVLALFVHVGIIHFAISVSFQVQWINFF